MLLRGGLFRFVWFGVFFSRVAIARDESAPLLCFKNIGVALCVCVCVCVRVCARVRALVVVCVYACVRVCWMYTCTLLRVFVCVRAGVWCVDGNICARKLTQPNDIWKACWYRHQNDQQVLYWSVLIM